MTQRKHKAEKVKWKELMGDQEDFLRPLVREVIQQVLEGEMEEAVGAGKGERTAERVGYRAGYYGHLSIKLCLTGGSSGLLKTRLKQSIELRKSRGDAAGQGSPTAIFQRGDGESKFELQGLFRVKVTATVAAHNLQLAIDGFNDVCG